MVRRAALASLLAAGACAVLAGATAGTDRSPSPRCFGAASRDPLHPCHNARLRLAVVPTPAEARTHPQGSPCRPIGAIEDKHVCEFGVPAAEATRTIALVGDSHAGHWRPAVDAVAQTRAWRGIAIGHASCPLSMAVRDLPEPNRSHCARWKRAVMAWFGAHPEISVVFVSELTGGSGVVPARGRSEFETAVSGYVRAWRALPPTVQHIVVIRDSPKAGHGTATCVERALARRRPAGRACAKPRGEVLDPDPAIAAAARMRSARVRTVDLTPFFCDRRRCFPVIGGALVHKDTTHLNASFVATLGPYLLRAVDRLARTWR